MGRNKNIVTQKSDKGNSVVTARKADYLDKIENLLNDTRKFEKINLNSDGIFNFAVNQEKRDGKILKKLATSNSMLEKKQGDILNQLGLRQL